MPPHLCSSHLNFKIEVKGLGVKKRPMMIMAWGEAASDGVWEATSDQTWEVHG
jgi:hypothetical protein